MHGTATSAAGRSTHEQAARESEPDGAALPQQGRARVVVENVTPSIDGGQFPAKASVGETVVVSADVFTDGHDRIGVALRHRPAGAAAWQEVDMSPVVNDRWSGEFDVHA